MSDIDLDHLRNWIGRTESSTDTVTPGLIQRFRAAIADAGHGGDTGPSAVAPPAIHWCLAPAAGPTAALGEDGHPARGGFLPPVPLPRRMWAGGALEFGDALLSGDEVTRRSRIGDVVAKSGRAGRLVFVTVEHEISTRRGIAVRERQDIVYRDAAVDDGQPAMPLPAAHPCDHSEPVEATTILLFRYSALTFNSHRIHYDRDYARNAEGYPGLIVHGPLQATLLLHFAMRLGAKMPARFSYRSVAPLFDGGSFTLNALKKRDELNLWSADASGRQCMKADAVW